MNSKIVSLYLFSILINFTITCHIDQSGPIEMKAIGENVIIGDDTNNFDGWKIILQNSEYVKFNKSGLFSRYGKNYSFTCLPNTETCRNLMIKDMNLDTIGCYKKEGKEFDLVGYQKPFNFFVDSNENNRAYYHDKSLYVRESELVQMQCSVIFWGNGNDYEKKLNLTTKIKNCPKSVEQPTKLQSEDLNLKLSRYETLSNCTYKFSKEDEKISCELVNLNTGNSIEKLEIKLLVEWGPQHSGEYPIQNKNKDKHIFVGSDLKLVCPIEGNTIFYSWFNITNIKTWVSKKRVFEIPKQLSVGFYKFQCEGEVGKSKAITFIYTVNVTEEFKDEKEVVRPEKSKIIFYLILIGSIAGGVLLLLAIFAVYRYC